VAVHEPAQRVRAEVFVVAIEGEHSQQAEIEELAWVDPAAPGARLIAPLSRGQILPAVAALDGVARDWCPAGGPSPACRRRRAPATGRIRRPGRACPARPG